MENKDILVAPEITTPLEIRVDFEEKSLKKIENLTCRGDFGKNHDRGKPRDFFHSIRYGANGSGRRPESAYW